MNELEKEVKILKNRILFIEKRLERLEIDFYNISVTHIEKEDNNKK